MELFEIEETGQFSFEPFAKYSFYTAINRFLVQQALAPLLARSSDSPLTIVDLACGTGAISQLIAEEVTKQSRPARIIAVDPSAEALHHAQKQLGNVGVPVEFVQGESVHLTGLVA